MYNNKKGITINELRYELDHLVGDGEVWIETSPGLSSPVVSIAKLNKHDIILTPRVWDLTTTNCDKCVLYNPYLKNDDDAVAGMTFAQAVSIRKLVQKNVGYSELFNRIYELEREVNALQDSMAAYRKSANDLLGG